MGVERPRVASGTNLVATERVGQFFVPVDGRDLPFGRKRLSISSLPFPLHSQSLCRILSLSTRRSQQNTGVTIHLYYYFF